VSNVWAIGQQYLTNQLIGPARVPGVPGAGGPKPAKDPKPPKDIVVQKMPDRQVPEPVTTEHPQSKPAKRAKTKS
jgi:hypothetical protein